MRKALTIVLTCSDFRFQNAISEYLRERGMQGEFELFSLHGACKTITQAKSLAERDFVLANLRTAKENNSLAKLILIHHRDCSAYGGSKLFDNSATEFQRHANEMKGAKEIIKEFLFELEVETLFADSDSEVSEGSICFKDA